MTPQEREQYEWLLDKSFDTDFDDEGVSKNPMPKRLVELHQHALDAGRRIGLTSVSKSTMVCLGIMAGCFDTPTVSKAKVLGPVKRPRKKQQPVAEVI